MEATEGMRPLRGFRGGGRGAREVSARGEEGGGEGDRAEKEGTFCTSTRSVAGRRRITARGAGVVPGRAGGAGDAPVFERDAHGVDGNASAGAGFTGRRRARRRLTARRGSAACGERVTVPFPRGAETGEPVRARGRREGVNVTTAGVSRRRVTRTNERGACVDGVERARECAAGAAKTLPRPMLRARAPPHRGDPREARAARRTRSRSRASRDRNDRL